MAHNSNAERNAIVRQWVTTLHMHGSIIGCNDANNHSNDDDDADDDHQQQLFVCAAREREPIVIINHLDELFHKHI